MVTLPNYEIVREIAHGAFGYVFEAYDHTNNKRVALKRVEKAGNTLSREYEILFDVKDCDYVIQILDLYYSKTDKGKLIQNIIFEYMDDNLENKLLTYRKNRKLFSEHQVKSYIYQILKGIEFCHSKGIAHRDLKPENVLIDTDENIKVCDFGSSKQLDDKGKNTPYIVSRLYRAPELLLCITKYTIAIDMWAVGCILAELITRDPIFCGSSEGDQLFSIFRVLGSPSQKQFQEFGKRVPFEAKIFKEFQKYQATDLREMFLYIKDIDNLIDLLNGMFEYLPEDRITATEALEHPFFKDIAASFNKKKNSKK